MTPQLRMLIWKECRERRGQFLICLLWMLAATLYCIAYEWSRGFRAPVASFYSNAMLYGLFMPLFLAMRTSLGELTERTRSFSDALPVSAQTRGAIRLAGGAITLTFPMILGALLLAACLLAGWLEQAPARPTDDSPYVRLPQRENLAATGAVGFVGTVTAVTLCESTMLYLLLSLLGTRLRAEAHLGFAGAAVAMVWFLGGALRELFKSQGLSRVADWIGAVAPQAIIINYGYGVEQGSYGDLSLSTAVYGPLAVNLGIQMLLAKLFIHFYSRKLPGRPVEPVRKRGRRTRRSWRLAFPTRGIALGWLTLRQSLPMCLPGLLIAFLMTPFQMDTGQPANGPFLQEFSDALPSAMWIIGVLWSTVVGAGIFSAELDRRIGEFWRATPISAGQLFAIKYIVGLLAVLLVLDGTTIAATWSSPNWGDYYSMNWPYVACIVPLHATMFAIAVVWTCFLRRPVLGGMAAILTFALIEVILGWSEVTREFGPIEVYNNLHELAVQPRPPVDFTAHGYPLVAMVMALVIVGSAFLGWQALRRYLPWPSLG